jgi:hypothetical protein
LIFNTFKYSAVKNLFKFMLMFAVIAATCLHSAHAQTGTASAFPLIAGDTLVNTDTVFKKIPITAGYSSMGVQVNLKKGTGTLGGKVYLYTSLDGANYLLTDSASFTAVPTFATTLASTSYTHVAVISKVAPAGASYIVAATQAGSLTASPVQVLYTSRRYNH